MTERKRISFVNKLVEVYSESGRVKIGKVVDETDRFIVLQEKPKDKYPVYINRMSIWFVKVTGVVGKDEGS